MKINGYEVKLKQIWERGNGDLAVITKFEDTIFPICILVYINGLLLGKSYCLPNGKCCVHCPSFDLIRPIKI